MRVMDIKLRGDLGWNQAGLQQFGLARWRKVRESLKTQDLMVAYCPGLPLKNPRSPFHESQVSYACCLGNVFHPTGISEYYFYNARHFPKALSSSLGLECPLIYYMDAASFLAACFLFPQNGESILDFCSAPGGKALVLASQLFSHSAQVINPAIKCNEPLLVCNDSSENRLSRLRDNLFKRCNSSAVSRNRIRVVSRSSQVGLWGPYDGILVDAPCSTDRHLMNDPFKLASWSSKTVKGNSERQLCLLRSVIPHLKCTPLARLVYCTCALSVNENDHVIEKLLNEPKYKGRLRPMPLKQLLNGIESQNLKFKIQLISPVHKNIHGDSAYASQEACLTKPPITHHQEGILTIFVETTKYGLFFLPDISFCGPLYIAALQWS